MCLQRFRRTHRHEAKVPAIWRRRRGDSVLSLGHERLDPRPRNDLARGRDRATQALNTRSLTPTSGAEAHLRTAVAQ
jgi:hypothetical protein